MTAGHHIFHQKWVAQKVPLKKSTGPCGNKKQKCVTDGILVLPYDVVYQTYPMQTFRVLERQY